MTIEDFLWRDEVMDKLAVKHGVEPWELESIFDDNPYIRFRQQGNRKGEDLYSAVGRQTQGGT